MSATIPTIEPEEFRAGDTVQWTRSIADYPASEGWTLRYRLSGPEQIDIASTADGDEHEVTLTAEVTADYQPGFYAYVAYVDNDDDERHTLHQGTFEVLENLATAEGATEGRSHARQMLEAIEAVMRGVATQEQRSMTIKDRALEFFSPGELRREWLFWRNEVQRERQRERRKRGLPTGNMILAKFTNT